MSQAESLYGEDRRKAFTAVSSSRARTVEGQLSALLNFFENHSWTKGAIVRGDGENYSYCMDGAVYALGFVPARSYSDGLSEDDLMTLGPLVRAIRNTATVLGYHVNKNWNIVGINDGLKNKSQLMRLLRTALENVRRD